MLVYSKEGFTAGDGKCQVSQPDPFPVPHIPFTEDLEQVIQSPSHPGITPQQRKSLAALLWEGRKQDHTSKPLDCLSSYQRAGLQMTSQGGWQPLQLNTAEIPPKCCRHYSVLSPLLLFANTRATCWRIPLPLKCRQ